LCASPKQGQYRPIWPGATPHRELRVIQGGSWSRCNARDVKTLRLNGRSHNAQKGALWLAHSPPSERGARARLAAHASWAKTEDPASRTAPAREAFQARFEREVDPDGILSPVERLRRADHARQAYFLRLSLAGTKARREKRSGGGS
jgi:hypothetical protein